MQAKVDRIAVIELDYPDLQLPTQVQRDFKIKLKTEILVTKEQLSDKQNAITQLKKLIILAENQESKLIDLQI